MDPQKSGIKTTELWVTVGTICGLLGAVLPMVIKYVPEGSVAYVIVSIVIAVAAAVFGYVKSRGDIKSSALDALATVNAARVSDPPKP
jgi:hypothetical protein